MSLKTNSPNGAEMTNLMEIFGDREESVYSAELYLLRSIAETSNALVDARYWPEFMEASGGYEKLEKSHEAAVFAYRQYLADGDG